MFVTGQERLAAASRKPRFIGEKRQDSKEYLGVPFATVHPQGSVVERGVHAASAQDNQSEEDYSSAPDFRTPKRAETPRSKTAPTLVDA
jgi:hypothetical protein